MQANFFPPRADFCNVLKIDSIKLVCDDSYEDFKA